MDLNFPVFATGVRMFRASNDVGSWVHTNTRKKTQGKQQNGGVLLNFLLLSIPLISEKKTGWNALTLWTPISCCAPGLLSYSYYFAYIPRQSVPKTDCQPRRRSILDSLRAPVVFQLQSWNLWYV